MRSAPGWVIAASALLAGSFFGCDDATDDDEKSRSSWCHAMCSAYGRCESSLPNCLSLCHYDSKGFFARSSNESLDRQSECMQRASCTPEFNDLLEECYSETLAGLEPSPEAMELCTAMAEPFFECNWFGTPQSCGRFHAAFSGPALAAERECSFASCEALEGCIAAQLYSFGE